MRAMRTAPPVLLLIAGLALPGCGDARQPDFPPLHPVKGVVKRGGKPVSGGSLLFTPDPETPDFRTNAEVGADGTYSLTTFRTTDRKGERKPGAPAGAYKVTYTPTQREQTAGGTLEIVELPKPVTVREGENDIPIELPRK